MENGLELKNKLDNEGNFVVSREENGGSIVEVVRYGVIKLIGDKTEYRVSYKTLLGITNKPEKFNGNVVIPELHLKVPISSIVFQQVREEKRVTVKGFTKLPFENFICEPTNVGEEFKPLEIKENEAKKTMEKYWLICAHYIEKDGVRRFDYNFNHVKEALLIRVEDGCPIVSRFFSYGDEVKSNLGLEK